MLKRSVLTLFQSIVLSLFLIFSVQAQQAFEKDDLVIFSADGSAHRFEIELAVSPGQRARGLMYRREMTSDAGMLFIYEEPQNVMMWMKNTYISLDMLFLDGTGRIVHIEEKTTPLSTRTLSSEGQVSAVLELNAGTVSRLQIKKGDIVHHRFLK
ncbi:DUF192 domain-containing protein [Kiloniella laminariae]|uniref:DUF192 domain-containing protein n=1 Tax=Kiloniella laminariae TaxID=454162 RepID=A0ABT4LNM2_9PROT|nr:DUF192 domain-containing protein [Kiloniella laminariae]MCZ4282703.1 DUF192 domain-containing protein [Kiloniella laminariae]